MRAIGIFVLTAIPAVLAYCYFTGLEISLWGYALAILVWLRALSRFGW